MQVDPDELILTRGQWLVDAIVWSGITKPTQGQITEKANVTSLRRYLGKMGGRSVYIYRLQCARDRSMAHPHSIDRLKGFARARKALEGHIEQLEIANDMRYPMMRSTLGESRRQRDRRTGTPHRPRGWGVCRSTTNKGGKPRWRLSLTSATDGRPRQAGTFGSREAAEQEGKRMIAELRGEAPPVG